MINSRAEGLKFSDDFSFVNEPVYIMMTLIDIRRNRWSLRTGYHEIKSRDTFRWIQRRNFSALHFAGRELIEKCFHCHGVRWVSDFQGENSYGAFCGCFFSSLETKKLLIVFLCKAVPILIHPYITNYSINIHHCKRTKIYIRNFMFAVSANFSFAFRGSRRKRNKKSAFMEIFMRL